MSQAAVGAGWVRPMSRGVFWVLFVVYLVFRLWLATWPGYEVDVNQYKEWALGSGLMGFPVIYEVTSADYPPLSLMVFYGVGSAFVASQPPFASGDISVTIVPTLMIKLPHIVFDLLMGGLLFWLVGRFSLWGTARTGEGWGRLAATLYWWNPAVLFTSAYWGQFDSMHAFFVVAAVAAMGADRMGLSGASLSAGGLSKPLAAPLVPLLVLTAALRRGFSGLLAAGLAGLAVAVLAFSPFVLTGRLLPVIERVLGDVNAMSFTSVNAHNLWWWLGAWQDASAPWIGPMTARDIGLCLFLLAYLAILLRVRAWIGRARGADYRAGLFIVAAGVMASFFFFSTHMHENHLFTTLPLLLAVAGRNRRLAGLAIICSIAILLNEFLHDPELPYQLPGWLSSSTEVFNRHLGRPFTQLQLVGSWVSSVLAALVVLGIAREIWVLGRTRDPAQPAS